VSFGLYTFEPELLEAVNATLWEPGDTRFTGIEILCEAPYHKIACKEAGQTLAIKAGTRLADNFGESERRVRSCESSKIKFGIPTLFVQLDLG